MIRQLSLRIKGGGYGILHVAFYRTTAYNWRIVIFSDHFYSQLYFFLVLFL